ncbi:hypothetical protein [Vibrio barjaei]|uniref:Uncharacterized protein n=1 Tax=Vibrio barjaei TaxID=1676683 RepID=A0ABW7IMS6_9VIBR|nr:hypothetical protein [Vibrio barjaei]
MKTLITMVSVILFSASVNAGDGPGTICQTESGHTITTNKTVCPANTVEI